MPMRRPILPLALLAAALLAAAVPAAAQVDQPTHIALEVTPFAGPLTTEPASTPVLVKVTYFIAPSLAQQDIRVTLKLEGVPDWAVANVTPAEIVIKPATGVPGTTRSVEAEAMLTVVAVPGAANGTPTNLKLLADSNAALMAKPGHAEAEVPLTWGATEPVTPASEVSEASEEDTRFVSALDPIVAVALTGALVLVTRRATRRER